MPIVVDIQILQTVSIAVASASVTLAAIYYMWQIRHQTRIRKTDLFIRLYSTFSTNEFQEARRTIMNSQFKDYEDYVQKYGSVISETAMNKAVSTVTNLYELVGVLLYRKQIDLGMVYDVVGSKVVKIVYGRLEPLMLGVRREFDEPTAYGGFEYLYNELVRKEPQLRKTWAKASFPPVTAPKLPNEPLGDKNG